VFRQALSASATGWLWFEDEPRSISVLFADGRAFVMALRESGDVGEVAIDPAAAGDQTPIAFTIDNGQVDTWPTSATISSRQAEQVLEQWSRGGRFEGVGWTASPPGLP
jgi:hypothetical protein